MKFKKSILLSIIEKCILKESVLVEAIDRQMEEDIIDLWANLLDSARDEKSRQELEQLAADSYKALTNVEESILYESPEIWKREIRNSLRRGDISIEQLASDIRDLSSSPTIGPWIRETSGQRDLLAKLGVGEEEETEEPVDVKPTSTTPDVEPPSGPTIPMPPGMTPRGLKAKEVLSKSLTQRDLPNMETVNQLRQFDRISGRKFEKALRDSQLFNAKVKSTSGMNMSDDDYLNIVRSLYTALNKLGVTKLSESRLKHVILEETAAVLKEAKKR